MSRRLAFYGGSFDPPHNAHLAIGSALIDEFSLDGFIYVPAFHAPHKARLKPTPAIDRYAMLCLATNANDSLSVSRMEIEMPQRPFSIQTLTRLNDEFPDDDIFFVIGADSWMDILTWREWEKVLTMANIVVVARPGVEIGFAHVTDEIRDRITDLRRKSVKEMDDRTSDGRRIYITDVVQLDISATEIRRKVREGDDSWHSDVPPEVAKYIEKYQIYS